MPVPESVLLPPVAKRSRARYESNIRLFEWITASMMLGISLIIALNPKSIQFGGFYLMAQVGLTAPVLCIIFLIAGTARMVALRANGNWLIWGMWLRFIGAIIGLVVWMQMLYALTLWSIKNGYVSIGVSVYLCLAIGEGFSCYRAVADGRSNTA